MRFWKRKPKEIKSKYLIIEYYQDEVYIPEDDDYAMQEFKNIVESNDYLNDIKKLDGEYFEVFIRKDDGTYDKIAAMYDEECDYECDNNEEDDLDDGSWNEKMVPNENETVVKFISNITKGKALVEKTSTIRYLCEEFGIPCEVSRNNLLILDGVYINPDELDKTLNEFGVGKACYFIKNIVMDVA